MMELLSHRGAFKHCLKLREVFASCVFASQFCSRLCMIIWLGSIIHWTRSRGINNRISMVWNIAEHLTRVFSLHCSIMPTTGESEDVNEEERTRELEQEKRDRTTAVTKTRHTEREWRRFRVDWKWNRNIVEGIGCIAHRHRRTARSLLTLRRHENKKAVGHKAEGPEKGVNNVIENAETGIKHILEKKKHANANKKTLLQPRLPKSPSSSTYSPAHSQSSNSIQITQVTVTSDLSL